MDKNKLYKKYDIDENKYKKIEMQLTEICIPENCEKFQKIANKYKPIIDTDNFYEIYNEISNGCFVKVYDSDMFNVLRKMCESNKTVLLGEGTFVCRARIVDEHDLLRGEKGICFKSGRLNGYDWINSKEPPIGISNDGRANAKNSSYFYCAENGNTAISEVKATIQDYVSLATFKLKKDIKLFDLSEFQISGNEIFYANLITFHYSKPIRTTEQYKFSQFISDEIRKYGYDGIRYKSNYTLSFNYVIFNCSMDTLEFVSSRILKVYSQKLKLIDYSTEKTIETKEIEGISEENILKEKMDIYNAIERHKQLKELSKTNNHEF